MKLESPRPATTRRQFTDEIKREAILLMCGALTGSPASYDAWAGRPESNRSV
jgi:hypothetical protein